jgi:hypothetical protein
MRNPDVTRDISARSRTVIHLYQPGYWNLKHALHEAHLLVYRTTYNVESCLPE